MTLEEKVQKLIDDYVAEKLSDLRKENKRLIGVFEELASIAICSGEKNHMVLLNRIYSKCVKEYEKAMEGEVAG